MSKRVLPLVSVVVVVENGKAKSYLTTNGNVRPEIAIAAFAEYFQRKKQQRSLSPKDLTRGKDGKHRIPVVK